MLDSLAAGGAPTPSSMMSTSRPLRAARDAVDSHKVWELDPSDIIDDRPADRLEHDDVIDLKDSIEATGQTVPILVRRHANEDGKYLLVYGRRRLEAIKQSGKVNKVRALIASLDDDRAVEAQISENMARRDLSYIEKALFANDLIENGFGNQTKVAEVLTVPKSAISMAIAIVSSIGPDLIRAIGPAHGIGRPRWEALSKAKEKTLIEESRLITMAEKARGRAVIAPFSAKRLDDIVDPSVAAFDAIYAEIVPASPPAPPKLGAKPASQRAPRGRQVYLDAKNTSKVTRTGAGLRIDVSKGDFADWVDAQADQIIEELHARWLRRTNE